MEEDFDEKNLLSTPKADAMPSSGRNTEHRIYPIINPTTQDVNQLSSLNAIEKQHASPSLTMEENQLEFDLGQNTTTTDMDHNAVQYGEAVGSLSVISEEKSHWQLTEQSFS